MTWMKWLLKAAKREVGNRAGEDGHRHSSKAEQDADLYEPNSLYLTEDQINCGASLEVSQGLDEQFL